MKTLAATLVTKLARKADYEIYPRWRLPRLAHGQRLRALFELFDIRHVLDVGANEGQFRDFLRLEVGFGGSIDSFEPMQSLAQRMSQRQAPDPVWRIHSVALGAEPCTQEINVTASTVFSSLLKPSHAAVPEFRDMNNIVRKESVSIETLDGAMSDRMRGIDLGKTFLKLDTQGFDLEVLKGGSSAVSRIPLIQTEVSLLPIYDGMPDMQQSLEAFAGLGFSVCDLFLVSSDKKQRAVEFDCLMVRA